MARKASERKSERGAALVMALGLLVIFSMLGTAYVRYATLEAYAAQFQVNTARADALAQGGIQAAIGEIQASLSQGKSPTTVEVVVNLPVYRFEEGAKLKTSRTGGTEADARFTGQASFTITDESARINLNHAPVRVLEAILGVDASTARDIRSSLPRPEAPGNRWFAHPSDLAARDLLEESTYAALNQELITVYTVADSAKPEGFINLNTASAEVLGAVLNIGPEVAQEVVNGQPFDSLQKLLEKTGNTPIAFNIPPEPAAGETLPPALAFESRCYRIQSSGTLRDMTRGTMASSTVEAVVLFPKGQAPLVRYWSEID